MFWPASKKNLLLNCLLIMIFIFSHSSKSLGRRTPRVYKFNGPKTYYLSFLPFSADQLCLQRLNSFNIFFLLLGLPSFVLWLRKCDQPLINCKFIWKKVFTLCSCPSLILQFGLNKLYIIYIYNYKICN